MGSHGNIEASEVPKSLSLVRGACPLSEEPVSCLKSLSLVRGACPLSEEPVPCLVGQNGALG